MGDAAWYSVRMSIPVANVSPVSVALSTSPHGMQDVPPCLSVCLAPAPSSPDVASGPRPAVLVCPGGGYGFLANDHEGRQVAQWLNARGVSAFVLHYRLGPDDSHPAQLDDARAALSLIRAKHAEWDIDPTRLGILGFSAGGHLAVTVATQVSGDAAHRPDFCILGYPVVTLLPPVTHEGSAVNLLGTAPQQELLELLSAERHVSSWTPPTFIFHTTDDGGVPVENSIALFAALRKAGIDAEFHAYAHGPHGVGLCLHDPALGSWPAMLEAWMRVQGFLA